MKIVFTGGGSGGHFYPIIATVDALTELVKTEQYVTPKLYFASTSPYNKDLLFERNIEFVRIPAGKLRRHFSVKNFFSIFGVAFGVLVALWKMFLLYPDVIVGKGGYASFPTLFAARILRIPVVIHESDAHPGRVNAWAGKFAKHVALAFPEAADYFPKEKTAIIGIPIRRELRHVDREGASAYLQLDPTIPTVLILGGSQGAQRINNLILEVLPQMLERYQVIHQVGAKNLKVTQQEIDIYLGTSAHKERYKLFGYLNVSALAMAGSLADLVICRAGATTLAEISLWQKPALVIPIPEEISHDQHKNAFYYSRTGAASLLEEENLTSHIIVSEINRIMDNAALRASMAERASEFSHPEAAKLLAMDIFRILLKHQL